MSYIFTNAIKCNEDTFIQAGLRISDRWVAKIGLIHQNQLGELMRVKHVVVQTSWRRKYKLRTVPVQVMFPSSDLSSKTWHTVPMDLSFTMIPNRHQYSIVEVYEFAIDVQTSWHRKYKLRRVPSQVMSLSSDLS